MEERIICQEFRNISVFLVFNFPYLILYKLQARSVASTRSLFIVGFPDMSKKKFERTQQAEE